MRLRPVQRWPKDWMRDCSSYFLAGPNCGIRVAQKETKERFMLLGSRSSYNPLSPPVWWGEGWGEGLPKIPGFAVERNSVPSFPLHPCPLPRHGGEGIRRTIQEIRTTH